MTTLLAYGAATTQYQTMQYTYVEEPHPLYISYVCPKQAKQDRHQETLERETEKSKWITKGYKIERK